MDNFEQRLKQQMLRKIPGEWRAEILAEARRESRVESRKPEQSSPSTLDPRLSTILWPHPKAWAGLAAVWAFIFILNFSTRDQTPVVAEKTSLPSPEVVAELKQQQRMLAELIGSAQTIEAEPPKILPLPRSERIEFLTV